MLVVKLHYWLLPFTTFSLTVNLGWGFQDHCKAKYLCFIFSCTFQLIKLNLWYWSSLIKLNMVILFLSVIYWVKGNNCWFSDCHKPFNAGIHSDIDELVWLKLGMIGNIKLYIWILVNLNMTLIHGYRGERKQKHLIIHSFQFESNFMHLTFFIVIFMLICLLCWIIFILFISCAQYSRETFTWTCIWTLIVWFLSTWYEDENQWSLVFNDLDLHSRSQ